MNISGLSFLHRNTLTFTNASPSALWKGVVVTSTKHYYCTAKNSKKSKETSTFRVIHPKSFAKDPVLLDQCDDFVCRQISQGLGLFESLKTFEERSALLAAIGHQHFKKE